MAQATRVMLTRRLNTTSGGSKAIGRGNPPHNPRSDVWSAAKLPILRCMFFWFVCSRKQNNRSRLTGACHVCVCVFVPSLATCLDNKQGVHIGAVPVAAVHIVPEEDELAAGVLQVAELDEVLHEVQQVSHAERPHTRATDDPC